MTTIPRGTPWGPSPPVPADEPSPSGEAASARQADLRTSIRPTVAEIDLAALRHNALLVRREIGPKVALYGVVKADAYGHGAVAVARALAPHCDVLAVSLAEEGLELRQAGLTSPVLVLGAYYGQEHSDIVEAGLTPVVYDPADLEKFARAPARRRKSQLGNAERLPVHLKVDSGMNRLGVQGPLLAQALDAVEALPRLRLAGLCTHFACADSADDGVTALQLEQFGRALDAVKARGLSPDVVHAANTAATLRYPSTRFGAVRPGLALYGATPSAAIANLGLRPVLRLSTKIMALHDVPAGAGVSYGHRFIAARPSRIAVLPVGYADGYPRHLQGGHVLLRGKAAPVAGVVCMDMVMVDVTEVPGVQVGDAVTIIGEDGGQRITIDDVAAWAGTLNYEIICGISKRVPRIYRDGGTLGPESDAVKNAPAGGGDHARG